MHTSLPSLSHKLCQHQNPVHHSCFKFIIHLKFSIFASMRELTERQNHSLRNGPSHNTSGDKPGLFAQLQAAPVQVTLSDTGNELVKAVQAFQWGHVINIIKTSASLRPDEWEHLFGFRFGKSHLGRNILHYIIAEESKTKDAQVSDDQDLRLRTAKALMGAAPNDTTKSNIINEGDHQGKTALHLAVIHRTLPFLQFLLENGADVNCQDRNGDTPLHTAFAFDRSNVVKSLVKPYAMNPLLGNKHGQTSLHLAAKSLSLDTTRSLRKCLDDREANPLPFDYNCMTPVDQARCSAWGRLTARKLNGRGEIPHVIETFEAVIAELLQEGPPQEHANCNASPRQHELRICSKPTGFCCVLGMLYPDKITTTPIPLRKAFPKPVAELFDGQRPLLKELRRRQFDSTAPLLSSWVHLPEKNVCKVRVSKIHAWNNAQGFSGGAFVCPAECTLIIYAWEPDSWPGFDKLSNSNYPNAINQSGGLFSSPSSTWSTWRPRMTSLNI